MSLISTTPSSNTIHISLLRVLGQGGFGKVFLAEMASSNGFAQRVAVKVLHPEYQRNPKLLTRLIDEARMLGVLNHQNIVKVHDVCEVDGQAAIIMEYVQGHSLSALLKESPISWGEAWQIIADCAIALAAAFVAVHPVHGSALQLIHRDVKPSNILLSSSGTVKLLDFGIAKMNGVRESKTSTHQMGTERYMAPEQWMENQSSSAVDVYSLGRTALELMYGNMLPRPPLERERYNQTILTLIQEVPSDGIPQILADTGRELLWSMLSYDPQERPSIAQVADRALALSEAMGVVSLRGVLPDPLMESEEQEPSIADLQANDSRSFEVSVETLSSSLQAVALVQDTLATSVELPAEKMKTKRWPLYLGLFCFCSMLFGAVSRDGSTDALIEEVQEDTETTTVQNSLPRINIERPIVEGVTIPNEEVSLSKEVAVSKVQTSSPVHIPVHQVVISSLPLGALVFIDGKPAGRTLLHNVELKEGSHHIELVFGDNRLERTVDIASDVRFVWRPGVQDGVDEWASFTP